MGTLSMFTWRRLDNYLLLDIIHNIVNLNVAIINKTLKPHTE